MGRHFKEINMRKFLMSVWGFIAFCLVVLGWGCVAMLGSVIVFATAVCGIVLFTCAIPVLIILAILDVTLSKKN